MFTTQISTTAPTRFSLSASLLVLAVSGCGGDGGAGFAADAASDANASSGRARRDAIERERLAGYQRRYEEYARVSRGLQALIDVR